MIEITDFRDFSICNWFPKFEDITPTTILVEIPEVVVEKFKLDEDVQEVLKEDCCKEFIQQVENALNSLNKNVFVKNNWHAPLDARMFSLGNSLQVRNIDDIIMYFTCSTIIQEDFMNAKGVPFYLALKSFKQNIHPAAEFRCIVINKTLRGITPRDWPTYYAHFKEEGQQIIEKLNNFFKDNIKMKFPRKSYVFDVVYSYPNSAYILDFGPLNLKTNLYAFNWTEIHPLIGKESPNDIAPVFRYLESDFGIMAKSESINKFLNS